MTLKTLGDHAAPEVVFIITMLFTGHHVASVVI